MIGDATRAALNGAPSAVAIAPAGCAEQPVVMREIGVGYDGSAQSQHALTMARELASELGARLSAFEAVSVPSFIEHGRTAVDATPIDDLASQAALAGG